MYSLENMYLDISSAQSFATRSGAYGLEAYGSSAGDVKKALYFCLPVS
jgi:hypothetical protein